MELKIVNPTADSYHDAVGISEERANELGVQMDDMNSRYSGQTVRTCHVYNEIAHMCNNPEELVFCVISHTNFLMLNYGIFICPIKPKANADAKE